MGASTLTLNALRFFSHLVTIFETEDSYHSNISMGFSLSFGEKCLIYYSKNIWSRKYLFICKAMQLKEELKIKTLHKVPYVGLIVT